MDAYRPLAQAAELWAAKTGRTLHLPLLLAALARHRDHDKHGTSWPAGSAERLVTGGWLELVDNREDVVATLDTYWRFLRATGRMASTSAEPKALVKEARRALRRSIESWDAGEGSPRLIDITPEQVRELTADVMADIAERHSRGEVDELDEFDELEEDDDDPWGTWAAENWADDDCPGCDECGWEGDDPAGRRVLRAADFALPEVADLGTFDVGHQDDAVVGELFRTSGYFRSIEQLLAWLGRRGRPVDQNGWLTLCAARQAVDALDLDDWVRETLGDEPRIEEFVGEHEGLGRLFEPAVNGGFIDIRGARAYPTPALPASDEDWVYAAWALLLQAHAWVSDVGCGPLVIGLLLNLMVRGPQSRDDLRTWWRSAPANDFEQLARMMASEPGGSDAVAATRMADRRRFDSTINWWLDTNIWRESEGRVEITELGAALLEIFISMIRRAADAAAA